MRMLLPPRRALPRRGGGLVALVMLFIVGLASPAAAHPYLLSSNPAAGAILTAAPTRIDIDYTEGLDRGYCKVVLVSPSGQDVDTSQVTGQLGAADLAVVPDQPLTQQGTWAVEWTAVGDDGHTVIGSFAFSIGHASANSAAGISTVASVGTAASGGGLQRPLRVILPLLTVLFAGLLLLPGPLVAAGRRAARMRLGLFVADGAVLLALAISAIADGGISVFASSTTGRRLIAELLLTALAAVAVFDGGELAAARRAGRERLWLGGAAAVGLCLVLALSGHASTQPESRRGLVIVVYTVHLLSVSIWLAALSAVALRIKLPRPAGDDPLPSLRRLVAVMLLVVLGTGLATTDWGLRRLSDVDSTSWGDLTIVLLALFVVIVALGFAATATRRRSRLSMALVAVEAVTALGTLLVAGILGQLPQPLDQPWASQSFATDAGMPVSVVSVGASGLVSSELAPGVPGENSLVVEVGHTDSEDFTEPATDVKAVSVTVDCGCGPTAQSMALRRGPGGEWTANVDLPKATTWLVKAIVTRTDGKQQRLRLTEAVRPQTLPSQFVIGVPAALSGVNAETCRDQILGMQSAIEDLDSTASDDGDMVRIIPVDLREGVAPAMARLRSFGAQLIAMPCGTSRQVQGVVSAAHQADLPVILGATDNEPSGVDVWSAEPDWLAEGKAIGEQAKAQFATSVTAVVGSTSIDRTELAGLRTALTGDEIGGQPVRLRTLPMSEPTDRTMNRLSRGVDLVALLGNRQEALPLVQAMSRREQSDGWLPAHGILASAQLMATDLINSAGTITRLGGIEFASDINPFDPVAQYYAQRLRTLVPGIRPSFDGVHGYDMAIAIVDALRDSGGDPTAAEVSKALGTRFGHFSVGSYQLGWSRSGGTSASVAFFRSTYINPMAMPSVAPGGASSLAHEGTFLNSGGFEQVAPFRRLT